MRGPHTSCHRGKRVVIVLRDGERVEDVFQDRRSRYVELRSGRRIDSAAIRSFRIARGKN